MSESTNSFAELKNLSGVVTTESAAAPTPPAAARTPSPASGSNPAKAKSP
jgi:hypothetical protein